MVSPKLTYREIIKQEFAKRLKRNPRYSLRAFAIFLGLPSAQLSDILNAKYGMSAQKAATLAKKLEYSEQETEIFCTLVEKEHARSKAGRDAAARKLESLRDGPSRHLLEDDAFEAISGWYHFPIVELTRTEGFVGSPAWIGKRLGISTIEADLAVERLKRLGLLKIENEKLVPSREFYESPRQATPFQARRNFHTQILSKAGEAIMTQPLDRRDFSAAILAIDSRQISEIREIISRFRKELDQHLERSDKKDSVYCVSVQLFDLGASYEVA
ncbi:MAG: hypothetical protein RJB38_114 [Pseudomonadota bacterium]|jgi:uncharacterized protein (TIGR02147 family)